MATRSVALFCLLLFFGFVYGQKYDNPWGKRTLFGVQISPVMPADFIENNRVLIDNDTTRFEFGQKPGLAFGMEMRHDFTRLFAMNAGINLVKRNYHLDVTKDDSLNSGNLGLICYEVPVSGLVYIRLSRNIYMNTSFGLNFNFFPSDVKINGMMLARRTNWAKIALIANVGFEYRTENSGTFYLGSSYNRMFTDLYVIRAVEPDGAINQYTIFEERGSYFSLNFKYFFPENR